MPGLITGALNAATQGAAGYGQGQEAAQQKNAALAMLLSQRAEQKRVDDARINEETAQANKADTAAPRDVVGDAEAIRDYYIKHPLPSRASAAKPGETALVHALSGTQRQEQLASTDAAAAQRDVTARFPAGAPAHVDPTTPGDSGILGFGAKPAQPNPAYPKYKADSTSYADAANRVQSALATRDSLSNVAGRLSSRLNAAALGDDDGGDDEDDGVPAAAPGAPAPRSAAPRAAAPAAPADPATGKPVNTSAPHLPEAQAAFKQAADALQAAGGPANAQARAQYNRVVQGISTHFQLTPPGTPSPGPGGTQAAPTPDE